MTLRAKLIGIAGFVAVLLAGAAIAQTWATTGLEQHVTADVEGQDQLHQLTVLEDEMVRALLSPGGIHLEASTVLEQLETIEGDERGEPADPEGERFESRLAELQALDASGMPEEPLVRRTLALVQAMRLAEAKEVRRDDGQASIWVQRAILAAWIGPLVSGIVLFGILFFVLRSITTPLKDLAAAARRVADGDPGLQVPVRSRDELGALAASFNDMQRGLRERAAERDAALRRSTIQRAELAKVEGFRTLSEAAPIGIVEVDAAGRPSYHNQRATELLGHGIEIDRPWQLSIDEAQRERAAALAPGETAELRGATGAWVMTQAAHLPGDKRLLTFTDITQRKLAVERAETLTRELVAVSRRAGMAEISAGVLHNVGNVMNSVNVSAHTLRELLRSSRAQQVAKAARLLEEHGADLPAFLATDRGKILPPFLVAGTARVVEETARADSELARIEKGLEHIKAIVTTQQSYAIGAARTEKLRLGEVIDDVLRLHITSFERHGISVIKELGADPELVTDRHKVMQILMNLVANARQAMGGEMSGPLTLIVRGHQTAGGTLRVEVTDSGSGIEPEHLPRLFEHGFTTKKDGHGFGLHSSALAAKELGGRLSAASEGAGRGATFVLELPVERRRQAA